MVAEPVVPISENTVSNLRHNMYAANNSNSPSGEVKSTGSTALTHSTNGLTPILSPVRAGMRGTGVKTEPCRQQRRSLSPLGKRSRSASFGEHSDGGISSAKRSNKESNDEGESFFTTESEYCGVKVEKTELNFQHREDSVVNSSVHNYFVQPDGKDEEARQVLTQLNTNLCVEKAQSENNNSELKTAILNLESRMQAQTLMMDRILAQQVVFQQNQNQFLQATAIKETMMEENRKPSQHDNVTGKHTDVKEAANTSGTETKEAKKETSSDGSKTGYLFTIFSDEEMDEKPSASIKEEHAETKTEIVVSASGRRKRRGEDDFRRKFMQNNKKKMKRRSLGGRRSKHRDESTAEGETSSPKGARNRKKAITAKSKKERNSSRGENANTSDSSNNDSSSSGSREGNRSQPRNEKGERRVKRKSKASRKPKREQSTPTESETSSESDRSDKTSSTSNSESADGGRRRYKVIEADKNLLKGVSRKNQKTIRVALRKATAGRGVIMEFDNSSSCWESEVQTRLLWGRRKTQKAWVIQRPSRERRRRIRQKGRKGGDKKKIDRIIREIEQLCDGERTSREVRKGRSGLASRVDVFPRTYQSCGSSLIFFRQFLVWLKRIRARELRKSDTNTECFNGEDQFAICEMVLLRTDTFTMRECQRIKAEKLIDIDSPETRNVAKLRKSIRKIETESRGDLQRRQAEIVLRSGVVRREGERLHEWSLRYRNVAKEADACTGHDSDEISMKEMRSKTLKAGNFSQEQKAQISFLHEQQNLPKWADILLGFASQTKKEDIGVIVERMKEASKVIGSKLQLPEQAQYSIMRAVGNDELKAAEAGKVASEVGRKIGKQDERGGVLQEHVNKIVLSNSCGANFTASNGVGVNSKAVRPGTIHANLNNSAEGDGEDDLDKRVMEDEANDDDIVNWAFRMQVSGGPGQQRERGGNTRGNVCFACGQSGRYARECPKFPNSDGTKRCYGCGSEKRLARDCPKAAQFKRENFNGLLQKGKELITKRNNERETAKGKQGSKGGNWRRSGGTTGGAGKGVQPKKNGFSRSGGDSKTFSGKQNGGKAGSKKGGGKKSGTQGGGSNNKPHNASSSKGKGGNRVNANTEVENQVVSQERQTWEQDEWEIEENREDTMAGFNHIKLERFLDEESLSPNSN